MTERIEDGTQNILQQMSESIDQIHKVKLKHQHQNSIKKQFQNNQKWSQFQKLFILLQNHTKVSNAIISTKQYNIYNLCESDIENLYLQAIYFLQKQLFIEFDKIIKGLTYERADEICKMLSLRDIKEYPLICRLQQRLFPILKFIYFQQPLTKFQLIIAEKSLCEVINGLYLHQQFSYNPQLQYDSKFLQQKIYNQPPENHKISTQKITKQSTQKQQSKYKHNNKKQEADSSQIANNQQYQKNIPSEDWTIQQQQQLAEYYCKLDENQFFKISQKMSEQFGQQNKFTENSIVNKLRSLFRTGILILKQFCKKNNAYIQFLDLFISPSIAKQILLSRSAFITHKAKQVLIALNFQKNQNKVQLFNLVDQILEYMQQKK